MSSANTTVPSSNRIRPDVSDISRLIGHWTETDLLLTPQQPLTNDPPPQEQDPEDSDYADDTHIFGPTNGSSFILSSPSGISYRRTYSVAYPTMPGEKRGYTKSTTRQDVTDLLTLRICNYDVEGKIFGRFSAETATRVMEKMCGRVVCGTNENNGPRGEELDYPLGEFPLTVTKGLPSESLEMDEEGKAGWEGQGGAKGEEESVLVEVSLNISRNWNFSEDLEMVDDDFDGSDLDLGE